MFDANDNIVFLLLSDHGGHRVSFLKQIVAIFFIFSIACIALFILFRSVLNSTLIIGLVESLFICKYVLEKRNVVDFLLRFDFIYFLNLTELLQFL